VHHGGHRHRQHHRPRSFLRRGSDFPEGDRSEFLEPPDVAVGVHALLAGPFLRRLGLPYALVFGGTDLYERMHDLQAAQMARAVAGAAKLVAFSPENIARAEWMWPSHAGRVERIPQAADVPEPEPSFSLRAELGLDDRDVLVVLPTGIRRVKDPLHVIDAFHRWHRIDPRVHLVLAGAVLEPDYADGALTILAERPGVTFLPALPRPLMLAAIREADAVINTSLSEGMCGVILEAMALETPIVARRNAGNESLIVHGHTGLLYDSPEELIHWIRALTSSPSLRRRIVRTAAEVAHDTYGTARERAAYLDLVEELGPHARPSLLPPPAPAVDELDTVVASGARVGLDPAALDALSALVARVKDTPTLKSMTHELAGLLHTAPPSVAIAQIASADLEHSLGVVDARAFYLLLALLEVPAAEARHEARGVDPETVRATLGDLAQWARELHGATGVVGITLEILEWAQRYLRGELFRVGPLQFDLRPFAAPMRVFRHRGTRALAALTLDGRPVDLRTGTIGGDDVPAGPWDVVLEPGSPVLEMWMPGSLSRVTLREVASGMRRAYALFARLSPETVPVAVCGETWRLDPQLGDVLPAESGVLDIQRACQLYPSSLSEAKTLRRLFGPDVRRDDLASLPRERLSSVQRAIADFLASPARSLAPRGGFVLRTDLEAMPEWS
jgi:glycosyltransferase involved in cell wall biosynthesis